MSFDVHFLSRDHLIERPRAMTPGETQAVLQALKTVASDVRSDDRLHDEYHVEAGDGGVIELYCGAKDASAMLSLRGVMPSHCVLMFEIIRLANWVAVFGSMDGESTLLATEAVASAPALSLDEFGEVKSVVVKSPEEIWSAMGGAFDGWRGWASGIAGPQEEV